MIKNKILPKLNLTVEEITEALKNIRPEDLLPPKDRLTSKPYYMCDHCRELEYAQVYGSGRNLCCSVFSPRN